MHTNKDGRRDECMLMCYVRNTWKELLCKFNQEQNTSKGMFSFFSLFLLFFNQVVIFSTGRDILTSSSTFKAPQERSHHQPCNARVIHPLSKKTAVQYFCNFSSYSSRTEYFTRYLTLLKESNISSAALLKDGGRGGVLSFCSVLPWKESPPSSLRALLCLSCTALLDRL